MADKTYKQRNDVQGKTKHTRPDRKQKLLILDLLEVLRKHSDREHPLTQAQITRYLAKEFRDYEAKLPQRAAIRSTLLDLKNAEEYPVYCLEEQRPEWNEDDEIRKLTALYYDHEFTHGELRMMIDSLLFTTALPKNFRQPLVEKIKTLSSEHFSSVLDNSDMDVFDRIENSEMIMTVETLAAAIAGEKQVSFQYCHCDPDFKLQPRKDDDGSIKNYVVSPYQLLTAHGHPYLVCHYAGHEGLSHFRLDRIKGITPLEDDAVHLREVKGFEGGMKLSGYLKQHPNLWSGKAVSVTFRCPDWMMDDVADWFGTKLDNKKALPNEMMEIRITISEDAMFHWALQYADCVKVVKPPALRERIADTLRKACDNYQKKE